MDAPEHLLILWSWTEQIGCELTHTATSDRLGGVHTYGPSRVLRLHSQLNWGWPSEGARAHARTRVHTHTHIQTHHGPKLPSRAKPHGPTASQGTQTRHTARGGGGDTWHRPPPPTSPRHGWKTTPPPPSHTHTHTLQLRTPPPPPPGSLAYWQTGQQCPAGC